jgi:hypothetical protein
MVNNNNRNKENQNVNTQKQTIGMPKVREFKQEKDLEIKMVYTNQQEEEYIEPQQFFF